MGITLQATHCTVLPHAMINLQDLNNRNKCVDMHGYDIHETSNNTTGYNDVMKPRQEV